MKLNDAVKKKGRPYYIPDCPRMGLPKFFAGLGYKTGAEIGVYKGKFCEKFCEQGIKMYAIDNWKAYSFQGEVLQLQERQDYLYNYTQKVLRRFPEAEVIRKDSLEAVEEFVDGSLDFVYIDADHSFPGIAADLAEWYPKVRSGGIVSGHDYAYTGSDRKAKWAYNKYCQVGPVVDAFIDCYEIKNFYIFGRSKPIELESKNDRYLSWMFFKP